MPDWASDVISVVNARRIISGASFPSISNSFLTAISARCTGQMCHCLVQNGLCLQSSGLCPHHGVARTLLGQSLLIRPPQGLWDIKIAVMCGVGLIQSALDGCVTDAAAVPVWWAWDWSPRTRQEATGPAEDTAWLVLGEKSWIWWHLWPQSLSVLLPHHSCSDFLWEGDDWFTPEGMNYHTGAAESKGNKLRREQR